MDNQKITPRPLGLEPRTTEEEKPRNNSLRGGIAAAVLLGTIYGLAYFNKPITNFIETKLNSINAGIEKCIKNYEQKKKRMESNEIIKVREGVFDYRGRLFTVEEDIVQKQGTYCWTLDGLLNKHHKCAPEDIPRTPLTEIFYKINDLDKTKPLQAYQRVRIPVAVLTPTPAAK